MFSCIRTEYGDLQTEYGEKFLGLGKIQKQRSLVLGMFDVIIGRLKKMQLFVSVLHEFRIRCKLAFR